MPLPFGSSYTVSRSQVVYGLRLMVRPVDRVETAGVEDMEIGEAATALTITVEPMADPEDRLAREGMEAVRLL